MALPTILVNATGGSDTQASGAGPATALFGTTDASTDGTGLIVTVTAGTDLSGVAIDGSHVIYLADATAGARNFGKITNSAGSGGATPTVTVADAFGLTLSSKSWAIGGKRASIGAATSKKLFDNNSAAGDAMPGWAVEMESGHTETIAATFDARRAGDQTSGPIILRGTSGAATLPVLTFSNNGNGIVPRGLWQIYRDFELRNSNVTKTASAGFSLGATGGGTIIGVKISNAANKFWKGIIDASPSGTISRIIGCDIGNTANIGIDCTSSGKYTYAWNYIHDCGATAGVNQTSTPPTFAFYGNVVAGNTGDGLRMTGASAGAQGIVIMHNTFYGNFSDGVEVTQAGGNGQVLGLILINNIFLGNGLSGTGYGINFSGATDIGLFGSLVCILNNNCNANVTAATNPTLTLSASGSTTADPQFIDGTFGSSLNLGIGTNLIATGYPTDVLLGCLTRSYVDPGAAQRSEGALVGFLLVAP